MVPTEKEACAYFRANGHAPACYQPFNALIYSLENCVPLVKFGQDDRWQADPNPRCRVVSTVPAVGWWARVKELWPVPLPDRATAPAVLRCVRWIIIGLGWLLATFFVAGLAGIIKTG